MKNLIFLSGLQEKVVLELFSRAEKLKSFFHSHGYFPETIDKAQVALLFGEPSTRTKLSFQMAAQRLGAGTLVFEADSNSSAKKGESGEDTFFTVESTLPHAIVVRCSEDWDLEAWAQKSRVPVLCGGYGKKSHPTQALLDIFTLFELWGDNLKGKKILFFGDLRHSRVFTSHRRLAKILGIELGVLAPEKWHPENSDELKVFSKMEDGMSWADALNGLRVQKERHIPEAQGIEPSRVGTADSEIYKLKKEHLEKLGKEQWILHPGPVNWGVELCEEVQEDPRNLIRRQVENGVFVRAALLKALIEGWK